MTPNDIELAFQLRYEHGLGVTEIADKFDITSSYASNILRGKKMPKVSVPLYLKYNETDLPHLAKQFDNLRATIAQLENQKRQQAKQLDRQRLTLSDFIRWAENRGVITNEKTL